MEAVSERLGWPLESFFGGVPSLIDKQAITYFTVIGVSKQKLLFS